MNSKKAKVTTVFEPADILFFDSLKYNPDGIIVLMKNLLTATPTHWNEHLSDRQGHLLQSWNWGEFKHHFGWTPQRIQIDAAAAQILFRQLPLGFSVAYIPKSPLVDWTNREQCQQLFSAIHTAEKKQRAVFLKVEPDVWLDDASPQQAQAAQTH
ncbi:MAG: peptidoglycan bridge formation glycyltransferase FemA/FemB family protein, partial [Anaerolineae bacterium]|nr:peptidoglycan bridge formation glycyltransferase FemA/FemB family protein [Anaerolineae bacterium]